MADFDPVTPPIITPLEIDQLLRDRVTEAVIAQSAVRHEALNSFLRVCLSGRDISKGALFSDPVIEAAASYVSSGSTPRDLAGGLLRADVVEALTWGVPGDDYQFDYPAYAHQVEAWKLLTAIERNSVLVSSGTGSGKTECFLVPLLNDLACEAAQLGRLTGVRALMLYPLNALIASQEERLRRWTKPFGGQIRFGLYNGLMQDKRKSERDKAEEESPEQVLYRTTLRKDPPPILVTNNTMLEYMTIRKEDNPIVQVSQGRLRWIVIDEAHSYVGSAAAEVSLLLRRVLQSFGVSAKDVRFVATSATIGGSDEPAKAALQRYLADLAGVPLSQVHVVLGERQGVELPTCGPEATLSSGDLLDMAILSRNPAVQAMVRATEKTPQSLVDVAPYARRAGIDSSTLVRAIAGNTGGRDGGSKPAALLPFRVHKFIRAVPGLWSCLNPACDGDKPVDWPFGAILYEQSTQCPTCSAPAFEIMSCHECGEPWLNAFDHGDQLLPAVLAPESDEFAATSEAESESGLDGDEDDIEEVGLATANTQVAGLRRLIATRPLPGLNEIAVDAATGAFPERRVEPLFWLSRGADDGVCPHCHAAPGANGASPLRPFRYGAPFLIQNAAPTVLDGVSPNARRDVELPAQGRQLLSFTDSRQGTARFAANIETFSERSYVRSFIYHMAQKATEPASLTASERSELEELVAVLRSQVAGAPILANTLADAEKKLSGQPETQPVMWSAAVKALARDPMIEQWIRAVWDERDERFRKDPEAFARFLLLRELARRPRRANAAETLGLAKLIYPSIDAISDARLPRALKEKSRTIDDWRSFLYIIIDMSIRSGFVLEIDHADARWLLPKHAFLRNIVGPGEAVRMQSDQRWPMAQPTGNQSNAVLILERALGLDRSSGSDLAEINSVLEDAWNCIRPVLEGAGSTYALNFEKVGIAAVADAWHCPVTRKVLPRISFGRTPYGVRGSPPGASDIPAPVRFPSLPLTFPRSALDQSTLREFVETAPEVQTLRQVGLWGDLMDRTATFAPYLRAEEHSAQQPPHRLRIFESEFKAGEINMLACSTTMEMGVDIGSVEAVLNTNVPPSIANYRQRVGRAGRRGQSFSSSLTLARDTPLDRETFRDPVAYLERKLRSPQVRLDSAKIVQRHANALLLATWFREASGQLIRVKSGEFFGFPQGLGLEPDDDPPIRRFTQWLADPSTAISMRAPLAALTQGTVLEKNAQILSNAFEMFAEAHKDFGRQWSALRDQALAASIEPRSSLEHQLRRMCKEPLLKELSVRSLLPGHGFPNAVIPFINDCRENRDRQRAINETEPEANRNRRYDYPSRNADIAIREYAPGAEVVIDGLVWTSAGVTLNWHRPAHDADARETQSIRTFWECRECHESGCTRSQEEECPACGSVSLEHSRFLEPAGFRVDWTALPHADTDHVTPIKPEPARISARAALWGPLLDPALGRCRATGEGLVFHRSRGVGGKGYLICLDCGRAAEEGSNGLHEHDALMPMKGQAGRCPGNDKTYAITAPLALGHEVLTDVAELQPVGLDEAGSAWALASAIREALSRRLGIEPRELGLAVERRSTALGDDTHSLFLFDQSAGGAGYAPRLLDDLPAVLEEAKKILDCPAMCERGCSSCVLTADLYAQQEIIDRKIALDFVTALLSSLAEPQLDDVAGPGSRLSPPVADALVRTLKSGDVICLHCADSTDISVLSSPPFSTLFATAQHLDAECRLELAPAVFATMDEAVRRGLRNASHRHDFSLWLGTRTAAANAAAQLATHIRTSETIGYFSRSVAATEFGERWGVGVDHPIVTVPLSDHPAMSPVPEDKLERQLRAGDRVKIISNDPGKPTKQFGTLLVARQLKEELEAADLWKPGLLASLSYSDRYLKAPLPVLLMMRLLSALRDCLAAKEQSIPISVHTDLLNNRYDGGSPYRLSDNWRDEGDRGDTIVAMAERLGFTDCDYDNSGTSHGRKLTIAYKDGSTALILFDQGFGYWRVSAANHHDFRAGPNGQSKALIDSSAFVTGQGESYFAVTRK